MLSILLLGAALAHGTRRNGAKALDSRSGPLTFSARRGSRKARGLVTYLAYSLGRKADSG